MTKIVGIKFDAKLTILICWVKFAEKVCFLPKTGKMNAIIDIWIFELVWVPCFSLNWQFWFFGPSSPKKDVYGLKLNITIEFRICKLV